MTITITTKINSTSTLHPPGITKFHILKKKKNPSFIAFTHTHKLTSFQTWLM